MDFVWYNEAARAAVADGTVEPNPERWERIRQPMPRSAWLVDPMPRAGIRHILTADHLRLALVAP